MAAMRTRLLIGAWLTAAAFLILLVRLHNLQILRGEELSLKGRKNFVQQVKVLHDRGIIYDRNGRILVDNRPSLDAQVTPAFLGKRDEARATLNRLSALVGLAEPDSERVWQAVTSRSRLALFQPVVIRRDLDPERVEAIEAERSVFGLNGVDIVEGRRRIYRQGHVAAHLLGYVNEIDPDRIEAERGRGNPLHYELGDLVGRDGVEHTYERELRGVDGYENIVVDAKGRRQHDAYIQQLLGGYRRVEPQPGHNVVLTLDFDLQERAEAAFAGRAGAVVALEVNSGAVLAFASVPEFDPNLVSGVMVADEKARLDADPLKPWVNRVIQGQYAPGSTFKVVTALAALTERATSTAERLRCPGFFRLGRQVWRCHKDSGHGTVVFRDAIKLSCDTYFYTMGARLGINALANMARLLGLGERTGIPLRGEQPGLVPDEAFHDRVDAATGGYTQGMVVNSAIGQGALLVTPLQLAVAYAAIANGGTLFTPQIVDRIETADFRVLRRFLPQARELADPTQADAVSAIEEHVEGEPPTVVNRLKPMVANKAPLSAEWLAEVQKGLFAVVNEPAGTAYWRRSAKVAISGKTGTAQVIRLGRDRLKPEEMDYFERDHAWFVAYAPSEAPEIVVAVLNEHAGHGSSAAAPAAVKLIEAYFELKATRAAQAAASEPRTDP